MSTTSETEETAFIGNFYRPGAMARLAMSRGLHADAIARIAAKQHVHEQRAKAALARSAMRMNFETPSAIRGEIDVITAATGAHSVTGAGIETAYSLSSQILQDRSETTASEQQSRHSATVSQTGEQPYAELS